MKMSVSSAASSSGASAISRFSSSTWRATNRWLATEVYSPAAIENAPASRPANPVRTMVPGATPAPATPRMSERFDTAVVHAEHRRAEPAGARPARVPSLARGDELSRVGGHTLAHPDERLAVRALLVGDLAGLPALLVVLVGVARLRLEDHRHHRRGPQPARAI